MIRVLSEEVLLPVGELHVKAEQHDLACAEQVSQIDGLITTVAAEVNLVFTETFRADARNPLQFPALCCALVLRPEFCTITCRDDLVVPVYPPVRIARIHNIRCR